jgi:hypothetical protein
MSATTICLNEECERFDPFAETLCGRCMKALLRDIEAAEEDMAEAAESAQRASERRAAALADRVNAILDAEIASIRALFVEMPVAACGANADLCGMVRNPAESSVCPACEEADHCQCGRFEMPCMDREIGWPDIYSK